MIPLLTLVKGIGVGMLISIPTGPVGFLCVRRTIAKGYRSGIISGLGSVTADMCYAAVVVFGLTRLAHALIEHTTSLRLLGGLFLIYLGITTYYAKTKHTAENAKEETTLFEDYVTTFFITMTNPVQLVSFTIVFGAVGALSHGAHAGGIFLSGLLLGAAFWWFALATITHRFRHRFGNHTIHIVNKVSGVVIGATGIVALLSSFAGIFR